MLIQSNIYIALAAVSLTLGTQIELGMKPEWHPYLFIIFFATFLEYNLNRLVIIANRKDELNAPAHHWVRKNLRFFLSLIAIACLGLFGALTMAKREVLITLMPIGCITLLYSVPIIKFQNIIIQLRKIPYLKIFIIALVWALVTVLLPVMQAGQRFPISYVTLILLERFFFVFSITIPFDIRDMENDKRFGIKTIPLLINENNARLLSYLSLLAFYLVSIFIYQQTRSAFILGALTISFIATFVCLSMNKIRKKSYYHYVILDGALLFQGLLMLGFYLIEQTGSPK